MRGNEDAGDRDRDLAMKVTIPMRGNESSAARSTAMPHRMGYDPHEG